MSRPTKLTLDSTVQAYAVLSAALFFVTGIAYLVLGRWPVTHQDFWRIYDTCLHRPWLFSTMLKYNGHSHFFPAQLWLADLRWLAGNQDFLFAAGLLFQLIGTGVLAAVIWRDASIGRTTRVIATMLVVVSAFWMGRASMTATGGFNCCYSLVLTCAALSFHAVGRVALGMQNHARLLAAIVICNTIASFSFGTGLTTWPTLLFLAYCLRLRWRCIFVVALAALGVALVFLSLPSREVGSQLAAGIQWTHPATYPTLLYYFCRLLGSPVLHICQAWTTGRSHDANAQLVVLATSSGFVGVILASAAFLVKLIRRNLSAGLETIAVGLITLNFIAVALITLARADHIRLVPEELNAPRYLYWTSLFWAGLLLFSLKHVQQSGWFRWPILGTALAAPLLAFPSHYREGLHWRYARLISQEAALSLIDGIHDNREINILSPYSSLVYRLAGDMRALRLDMFAAGYQDWIGHPVSTYFPERRSARLKGNCQAGIVQTQPLGVRIRGSIVHHRGSTPHVMLIIDPGDIIRGIAFDSSTPRWINRLLYARTFRTDSVVGFIAHYNPNSQYTIRSIEKNMISSEAIAVPPASLTKSE